MAVVIAIFVSGVVAGVAAVDKLLNPQAPDDLLVLAIAGVVGVVGNGRAPGSALRPVNWTAQPLEADGHRARVDAVVSSGVVLSALVVGLGFPLGDPIIALAITGVIGHIT
jgi:divalent metal cation (Fe/Co/Zn/Cd) transporter